MIGKILIWGSAALAAVIIIPNVLPASDSDAEGFAKRRIQQHLKDPDSARFSNVQFHKGGDRTTGGMFGYVCGSVNAKNSFGAYGGDTRFIVDVSIWNNGRSGRTSSLMMDDADLDAFNELWRSKC